VTTAENGWIVRPTCSAAARCRLDESRALTHRVDRVRAIVTDLAVSRDRLRLRATLEHFMFVSTSASRRCAPAAFVLTCLTFACAATSGSSDDGVTGGTGGASSGAAGTQAGSAALGGAGGAGGSQMVAGQSGASGGGAGTAGASAGSSSGTSGASGATSNGGAAGATAGTSGTAGLAGTSGAAGDAGHAGAAGSAGSSSDPCSARSGLLFCEGFENVAEGALPDDPRWTSTVIGDGTLGIDATLGHTGEKSLLVHGAGFQTLLTFHDATVLPPASGRLFVRAFVRLAEPMTGGHNTFIIADTAAAPGQGNAARVGEMAEMLMMTVTGDTHGALSNDNHYTDGLPGVVFPPEEFVCLELLFDSAAQEINTWVEGVEVPDLHRTDWPVDPYDALRFGFEQYAGPASDIWYDDIAIGTEPIGCE
jgi:hypothetical protein